MNREFRFDSTALSQSMNRGLYQVMIGGKTNFISVSIGCHFCLSILAALKPAGLFPFL